MTEADSIEIFADRGVYLGIVDRAPCGEMFSYDEVSGEITAKDDYDVVNLLIDLELDPAKGDSVKAEEYLKSIGVE